MGILSDIYSFRDCLINAENKFITTGEFSLWCALKMFQKENEEYFQVPGWHLEKITGLSRNGIHKARERLISHGLIEYIPERAVNKSGQYRFINQGDTKNDTEVDTNSINSIEKQKNDIRVGIISYAKNYTESDTKNNAYGNAAKQFKKLINIK